MSQDTAGRDGENHQELRQRVRELMEEERELFDALDE
jgi:hypothetical protein